MYKVAHLNLKAPDIRGEALDATKAHALRRYDRASARLWSDWKDFDAAYWREVEAQQEEEEIVEAEVVPTGTALCDWSCILCESGGNPQAMSPSGYWGLYQFDYQTWVGHGGDPDAYGSAGAAEQHTVAARISYDAWPNC